MAVGKNHHEQFWGFSIAHFLFLLEGREHDFIHYQYPLVN